MFGLEDRKLMALALKEASEGEKEGEVPVGAVAILGGRVIASAHNRPISLRDPTAHAEMLVLRAAARAAGAYRLPEVAIYATLEPCVMCVGAMVNARVGRLVFGARDRKAGALGSVYDIGRDGRLNHRIEVLGGLMEAECAGLLLEFFRRRRGTDAGS